MTPFVSSYQSSPARYSSANIHENQKKKKRYYDTLILYQILYAEKNLIRETVPLKFLGGPEGPEGGEGAEPGGEGEAGGQEGEEEGRQEEEPREEAGCSVSSFPFLALGSFSCASRSAWILVLFGKLGDPETQDARRSKQEGKCCRFASLS